MGTYTNSSVINYSFKNHFWVGVKLATPIVIGYIPISITLGLIAIQNGLSISDITLMSLFVFAGSSQFVAINMLTAGAALSTIILTTFVLNFRHFIMSMSLMNILKKESLKKKIILSFWVTDESFAIASLRKMNVASLSGLMLTTYGAWVGGTFLGALLSNVLPKSLGEAMSIAIYAMFIGLLTPEIRKSWRIGLIAVFSGVLSYFFSLFFNTGWSIILATVLGSMLGIYLLPEEKK